MYGATAIHLLDAYNIQGDERKEIKPAQVNTGTRAVPQELQRVGSAQAAYYGWYATPPQVEGMSTYWVDQIIAMPVSSAPWTTQPPQQRRSFAEREAHYRSHSPLFLGAMQRAIRDDTNTQLDIRTGAAPVKPSVNPTSYGSNQPGGVRMSPALGYDALLPAWRVPRFSTEPYTIVPIASP
jgi:hypothetical protein